MTKSDFSVIYAVDVKKESPLHICAKEGHTTLVEFLLLKGKQLCCTLVYFYITILN